VILLDVLMVWAITALALFLVVYLGIHVADLLMDKHWHW
jgi:hypothetical protein